jgi:hypothetical protein
VPLSCGFFPPPIAMPADGAVVSGVVPVRAGVPEGPCVITASTVVKIFDAAGVLVRTSCDVNVSVDFNWDTRPHADGLYRMTAQRACSCDPNRVCAETTAISVTVRNR